MVDQALSVLAGVILAVTAIYVGSGGPGALALVANVIALLAIGCKTYYDLQLNPRKFEKEKSEITSAGHAGQRRTALFAARERRDKRAERSTLYTFLALAVSYFLFIAQEVLK
jgi:hypothetical protein